MLQSKSRAGSTNALQVLAAENRPFLLWATICEPGWRSKCWNIKPRISSFLSATGVWTTRFCGSGNWVREYPITSGPGIELDAWAIVSFLFLCFANGCDRWITVITISNDKWPYPCVGMKRFRWIVALSRYQSLKYLPIGSYRWIIIGGD